MAQNYNWCHIFARTASELISAGMIAAALGDVSRDLKVVGYTAQIIFSTYFLGLATGLFVAAAFSEVTSRKDTWLFCNAWWNSLCPLGNSKALMIAVRLVTETGASSGIAVHINTKRPISTSSSTDCCHSSKLTGPIMADIPVLDPIFGGIIAQLVVWPWIFWIKSIFDGFITLAGYCFIRESYTPVLLRRKAKPEAMSTSSIERTFTIRHWQELLLQLSIGLIRPFQILIRRPVIQLITFIFGVGFGIYTILILIFAALYIERHSQSVSISALHYISIDIGAISASQIGDRIMDWLYRRLSNKNNNHGRPEFRVPYSMDGAILMPIEISWHGWVAEVTGPWVLVDIGASVFTLGNMVFNQGILAHQLDEFGKYGVSENAASRVGSNIMGFILPISGPQLYDNLGVGWDNPIGLHMDRIRRSCLFCIVLLG
ncbi:MFS multidrug transporter [Botrytis cinerea]